MTTPYPLADVAALIGEPTRAAILLALLDGRALPATDLARAAQLSAPATSLHLAKLVQGGLLVPRKEGRHRYYRLASEDVAHALEALGVVATAPPPARSMTPERAAIRAARTCYDHLAGTLAVRVADALERAGVLVVEDDHAWRVTTDGAGWLARTLDVDASALVRARRPVARRCLDWTERRPHVAGALGAALLDRFVERRWLARTSASRAVRVTARGEEAFRRLLA